jgi:glucokinase
MKKILTADIGGTNSRFAFFQLKADGALSLADTIWLKTREFQSFFQLLQQLKETEFSLSPAHSDAAVFAFAGPIENGVYSNPPNIAWDIDVSNGLENFGLQRCLLINDFVAQAYACRSPIMDAAQQILPGDIVGDAPLAVIGAGTGLGQAALISDGKGNYLPVPSEGGHNNFPFESKREYEYKKFLLDTFKDLYVEAETVVSGKGLSLVHQFLSGQRLEPPDVAATLTPQSDTLKWMARFYGRACRIYALQVLARGGVYIAGGVAAKIPELVTHSEFKAEFRKSKTMAHVLNKIPVFLNTNEESGLWGAAVVGKQILRSS